MPSKCSVFVCQRPTYLCGYCREHYERDIEPRGHLTKRQLRDFILAVQTIASAEFSLSLPAALVPETEGNWSKEELREAYRETKRYVDTYLRAQMMQQCSLANRDDLQRGGDNAWESMCLVVARALFGEVLVHPRLPNNKRPDIVPRLEGICLERVSTGSPCLLEAPVIIEVKQSILHPRVFPKYGLYAKHIEVWFYRWRPHWLIQREEGITYQSPIELACRLEKIGERTLASLLRSLPLLWRTYELLPHYLYGVTHGLDECSFPPLNA